MNNRRDVLFTGMVVLASLVANVYSFTIVTWSLDGEAVAIFGQPVYTEPSWTLKALDVADVVCHPVSAVDIWLLQGIDRDSDRHWLANRCVREGYFPYLGSSAVWFQLGDGMMIVSKFPLGPAAMNGVSQFTQPFVTRGQGVDAIRKKGVQGVTIQLPNDVVFDLYNIAAQDQDACWPEPLSSYGCPEDAPNIVKAQMSEIGAWVAENSPTTRPVVIGGLFGFGDQGLADETSSSLIQELLDAADRTTPMGDPWGSIGPANTTGVTSGRGRTDRFLVDSSDVLLPITMEVLSEIQFETQNYTMSSISSHLPVLINIDFQ